MKKLFACVLLVLSCILNCGTSYYSYHRGHIPEHVNHAVVIPIWIDTKFNKEQLSQIKSAVNEWNNVFNGQMLLKLDKQFTGQEEGEKLFTEANKTGLGWVIVNLDENDPVLSDRIESGDGTLAFVTKMNGHLLVVIGDRIGTRDLKTITMHEMGHLLGANHVNAPSLMTPRYGEEQYNCIDKITVAQVAGYQDLEFANLNYCITPYFN